jgi:hypothetical protein
MRAKPTAGKNMNANARVARDMVTEKEWLVEFMTTTTVIKILECMYPSYIGTLRNWWYLYHQFWKSYEVEYGP